MPFPRSDAAGARRYVASVFAAGGFAPGRRPPSEWTDAYTLRLANAWQRQTAQGQPLTRQVARGHRPRVLPGGEIVSTEHPRQFVMRQGRPVSTRGVAPTRLGVIVQREYRDPAALFRWMTTKLPSGTALQIVAHGELKPEYAELDEDAEPEPDDEDVDEAGDGIVRVWRTIYTGDTAGTIDENGVTVTSLDELWDAAERVFIRGTIDRWIIRWQ